ncbi:MAG: class I SAM-dependent rRNA methyltransferase [Deltaproteobacteria bacterium]|nr:class I SAM-dependent rRNA methyltransferase [Deltaproteobacteria bacterium]
MTAIANVAISKKGLQRLRQGFVWIFRSDLDGKTDAEPGAIVKVIDRGNNFLAYAFYSQSELALRVLTREDRLPDRAFFGRRLDEAIARRARYFPKSRDAMRVVHGEADMLPGWLVDRFGDALVVQSMSLASDQREPMLIELLIERFKPRAVVFRDDGMTREYEGLDDRKGLAHGTDARAAFHEGEIAFEIDLLADQKTGAFLDQYENHLLAAEYAKGEALDLFCYHGGFGLQMAKRAARVTCVDQSELAVSRVKANAERNGLANVTGVAANAFDLLREHEQAARRFDTIVIDPPAFAKRKSAIEAAYRGYKDLNMRAMRCLEPGGILISCSCSAKMTRDLFEEMLIDASRDAKRRMLILERRGASRDHPGLAGVPETEYLKCFVLQAVD